MSLNTCTFEGNLTADPKFYEGDGTKAPRATFTLAVDRDYLNEDGEKTADFLDFVVWRSTAEFVAKHFRKGDTMTVCNSKARIRSFTNDEGVRKRITQYVDGRCYFGHQARSYEPDIQPIVTKSNDIDK
jgi:single-strand DNA-binding protein